MFDPNSNQSFIDLFNIRVQIYSKYLFYQTYFIKISLKLMSIKFFNIGITLILGFY